MNTFLKFTQKYITSPLFLIDDDYDIDEDFFDDYYMERIGHFLKFKEEKDYYHTEIVAKFSDFKKYTIKVIDEEYLEVSFKDNNDGVNYSFDNKVKLPSDCDSKTLDAEYDDGKIIITVNKKSV